MPASDLTALSVVAARDAIVAGTLSPVDLVDAYLARIAALDSKLQAWIHVDDAGARAVAAERADEAKAKKFRGWLHGIPVGIKDIFDVAGMPTTCGAKAWAHTRPATDASSVARLRQQGAVILGKTHTTEFAYRDPSPARNPWNLEHTPGGSSSGSAAAVAARMVPLALGSQTVGSVLRPAAYCGIVGFKGVHGKIPTDGVAPLAWSLDHVGIFGRSVADVRVALEVYGTPSGVTAPRPPKLALVPELVARAEPEIAAQVQATARAFAAAGATVEEIRLPPSFAEIHAAGDVILEVECSTYHEASFGKYAADFGTGLRALVEKGLTRRAADYVRADRARQRFRHEAAHALLPFDAVISPTAPQLPPRGLAWTGDASLCAPWSSAGFPAISLPAGVAPSGLPYAVQLIAIPAKNDTLLHFAGWCEDVLKFTAAPAL